MRRFLGALALLGAGMCLDAYIKSVLASRNASGTYSTPNTFVTGTTISSTAVNANFSDIATEMTDSLDRSGKGPMLAPLHLSNGTNNAPSLTFDSDTDTGLYSVSANDLGVTVGGSKVGDWTTSGAAITGILSATGNIISGSNVIGASPTVVATTSDTNVILKGNRSAGSATYDITLNSTATRSSGGLLDIQNNTTSKLKVDKDGYVLWLGANPAATTGFANTTTPLNVAKSWALISANMNTSSATLTDGFNVASVSATNTGNGTVTVNFATAMADTNYAVISQEVYDAGTGINARITSKSTSSFTFTSNVALVAGTSSWYLVVYGRQ